MVGFKDIFIHCSNTDYGSAMLFDRWHKDRGWSGIGYHFVISNGRPYRELKKGWTPMIGNIEAGRDLDDDSEIEEHEVGAHVFGFNRSIGICLVGKYDFPVVQYIKLFQLVRELKERFDIANNHIYGHCEAGRLNKKYATTKTCPNQPMEHLRSYLAGNMTLNTYLGHAREHIDNLRDG